MADDVEVWPENWRAWSLFAELDTQWHRAGMSGNRVGLMYAVAWERLDRMRLSDADWQHLYDDLRFMERAGLEFLAEQARLEAAARKSAGKG